MVVTWLQVNRAARDRFQRSESPPQERTMDSSPTESRGTNSSNLFFNAGAVVLLVMSAFLASLRTSPVGSGPAYLLGLVFGVASVGVLLALVVYGIARAFGKAKSGAGRAKIAFWTMFALFVLHLGQWVNNVTSGAQSRSAIRSPADTIVTDAERQGLQISSDSIRHAGLGFVLPHPGSGFRVSPELQRQLDAGLSGQPGMAAWALRDTALGQALVILVGKFGPVNEAGFRTYAAGMRKGVSKSKIVEDTLNWRDPAGEYRLTLLHPAGAYITTRCVGRIERSAIVCVQATAKQPNAMEGSREGLRFIM
jgi:hypothetical protein